MQGIGIGDKGSKKIDLLCTVNDIDENGDVSFSVINGGWDGELLTDGTLLVNKSKCKYPNQAILWEGNTPKEMMGYNNVISWINDQLK